MAFIASYSASGPPVALRRRSGLMIFRSGLLFASGLDLADGLLKRYPQPLGAYPQLVGLVPATVDARHQSRSEESLKHPAPPHAAVDEVEDGAYAAPRIIRLRRGD